MTFDSGLLLQLGNVFERIEENYTSEKLFTAADIPLYNGLRILLDHTRLVEEMIATYFTYPTRKYLYTLKDKKSVHERIYGIFSETGGDRIDHIKVLHFNRELLVFPLALTVAHIQPYLRAVAEGSDDAQRIADLLYFLKTDKDVTPILLRIEGEYERFLLMRESIIEKYYRLLVKEVRKDGPHKMYWAEDMALEYYLALLRSFARFDLTSGTYGSYVTSWFRNAKSFARGDLEMGTAFSIPNPVRVKIARGELDLVNYAVPEEKVNYDELHTKDQQDVDGFDMDALNQIVAAYDRTGLYRMINDLEFDPKFLLERHSDVSVF